MFEEDGFEFRKYVFQLFVVVSREQVRFRFQLLAAGGGRQRRAHAHTSQTLACLISAVEVLTRMFLSRMTPSKADKPILRVKKPADTAATKAALKGLYLRLVRFHDGEIPVLDSGGSYNSLASLLERHEVGERCGEHVYPSGPIDDEHLKMPESAGIVQISDLLLMVEPWFEESPGMNIGKDVKARYSPVQASGAVWEGIVEKGLSSGVFRFADEGDLFKDCDGKPFLSGAFGISKIGFAPSGHPAQ